MAHPHHRIGRGSRERPAASPGRSNFADAAQLARLLGVEPRWVLDHARELGGVRLGAGRGRLRFNVSRARRATNCPHRLIESDIESAFAVPVAISSAAKAEHQAGEA